MERSSLTNHLNHLSISNQSSNVIELFHCGATLQARKWVEVGNVNLCKVLYTPSLFLSSNIKKLNVMMIN